MTTLLESEVPSVYQEARTPFRVPVWQRLDLFIAHFASQGTGDTILTQERPGGKGLVAASVQPD